MIITLNGVEFETGVYRNIKKGTLYYAHELMINEQDGQVMIKYENDTGGYCREINEFFEKFVKTDISYDRIMKEVFKR